MKRYNLSKIMKEAHKIAKYMRLYNCKTWGDCLRAAWAQEKRNVKRAEASQAKKEAMKEALSQTSQRSSYDYLNVPLSAYYSNNNRGRFGSCFVGD